MSSAEAQKGRRAMQSYEKFSQLFPGTLWERVRQTPHQGDRIFEIMEFLHSGLWLRCPSEGTLAKVVAVCVAAESGRAMSRFRMHELMEQVRAIWKSLTSKHRLQHGEVPEFLLTKTNLAVVPSSQMALMQGMCMNPMAAACAWAALGSAATQAANAQPSMLALTAPEASAPAERSPAPPASAVSVEDLEDSQAPNPCGRMPALTAEDLSGNQASAKECVKEEAEDEVAAKTQEEKPAALREAMTGALRETKE
ncbi:unnamed protein product, partial [Durusdinium trenchii]